MRMKMKQRCMLAMAAMPIEDKMVMAMAVVPCKDIKSIRTAEDLVAILH